MKTTLRRTIASTVAGMLLLAAPSFAFASDWEIDTAHSRVGFAVRHMMVSNTRGVFGKYTATLALDDKDITQSKLHVDIDAASINTENAKRDEHLKSADFFDVAKFPKIIFDATKFEKQGDKLIATGTLTLKGVTKPVSLTITNVTPEVKDPMGIVRRGAQATTKISRKEFGLTWNKTLETGGVAISDDVNIDIDIELTKKK